MIGPGRVGGALFVCAVLSSCNWLLPVPKSAEISCVDVETSYCHRVAEQLIASPPPGHGAAQSVVLRCITKPPCAADRLDSEGIATVSMSDGFLWDQGFGPSMGT
jgi:hypothetical protein